MSKTILAAALCLATITPVLAQAPSTAPAPTTPMQSPSTAPNTSATSITSTTMSGSETFLPAQKASDWRASKLIGTAIMGPDNTKIGDVNDVLLDNNGNAHAVVIGVGGFLGVGEKDVAVPFNKLSITPTAAGDKIEKITVSYRKEELQNAPTFKWIAAANTPPADRRPVEPVRR